MTEKVHTSLEEGLVLRDVLPLGWEDADAGSRGELQIAQLNEANESVLRVVALLEEHRSEAGEDHHGGVSTELARLDNKMNMLLDLVNRLLRFHISLPDSVPVVLGVTTLEWESKAAPQTGSSITVQLYLHPSYPIPLGLPATVHAVEGQKGHQRVQVTFEGLSEPVRDGLEKLIFRHHRRAVAQARRAVAQHQGDED